MIRKRTRTAQGAAVTINGHPALSIEEAQQWFNDAYGVAPPHEKVWPIVAALNHCALFEAQWKNTFEFKQARRNNPSRLRMERLGVAIATLLTDVPVLIEDARKINPNSSNVGLTALLDAATVLAPAFEKFGPRGRGREPEGWHRIAGNVGPMVVAAAKSAGVKRIGFGKATSPAVRIMRSALEYLGVGTTPEAIVDAMRGRAMKGGKKTR